MLKEKDIAYSNGHAWVWKAKDAYYVMVNGITHSTSDSAYELNADGFSIAKARCNYLAKRMTTAGWSHVELRSPDNLSAGKLAGAQDGEPRLRAPGGVERQTEDRSCQPTSLLRRVELNIGQTATA